MNLQQILIAIKYLDSLPQKNSVENWLGKFKGITVTGFDNSLLVCVSEHDQLFELYETATEYLPPGTKLVLTLPPGAYESRNGIKTHPGVIWNIVA
ncbi:MAG: hypothetical protein ACKO2Z_33960 [Sphaerospermopsis kisseleviana]